MMGTLLPTGTEVVVSLDDPGVYDLTLPEGYDTRIVRLRSGLAPGRPYYWRITVRINDTTVAIVREGQEPSSEERLRALASACADIRRQEGL